MGPGKKLDRIAGCLIAFACKESFKRGHDGCIFLIPKTYLINHYQEKYGFHYMPWKTEKRPEGFMILYEDGSRRALAVAFYFPERSRRACSSGGVRRK